MVLVDNDRKTTPDKCLSKNERNPEWQKSIVKHRLKGETRVSSSKEVQEQTEIFAAHNAKDSFLAEQRERRLLKLQAERDYKAEKKKHEERMREYEKRVMHRDEEESRDCTQLATPNPTTLL